MTDPGASFDLFGLSDGSSSQEFKEKVTVTSTTTSSSTTTTIPCSISPSFESLCFFVSCTNVDGNLLSSSSRSAHTIVRGAISMIAAQTHNLASKTKSPRIKAPTEVNIEVRASCEIPCSMNDKAKVEGLKVFESENWWSERRKSRHPCFTVGFQVSCHVTQGFDRPIEIAVMIPDESSNSNTKSQLFGTVQTSFQEMYTMATSGNYQQPMILPLQTTLPTVENAYVTIRFNEAKPFEHTLLRAYHPIVKPFFFYPKSNILNIEEDPTLSNNPSFLPILSGGKIAIEEANEVDFSVTIPLELLKMCHLELKQMYDEWKTRYNYRRKKNKYFEDDIEALDFGYDVYRVQIIRAKNLITSCYALPSSGGGGGSGAGAGAGTGTGSDAFDAAESSSSSGSRGSFSLPSAPQNLINRIKVPKWVVGNNGTGGSGGLSGSNDLMSMGADESTASAMESFGTSGISSSSTGSSTTTSSNTSTVLNPFAVVRFMDSILNGSSSTPQESLIGRTNTEYDTLSPNWSTNERVHACPHSKPNTKYFVSTSLPSHVEISEENKLKSFVFHRLQRPNKEDLGGWLKLEVMSENYTYMSGIDNAFVGEVVIPLHSLHDGMKKEEKIVDVDPSTKLKIRVLSITDWFDLRTDETVCGQIRLHLVIQQTIEIISTANADASSSTALPRRLVDEIRSGGLSTSVATLMNTELPLNFLYPHVLKLQKHFNQVGEMIRLCEHLIEQKKTFKSSQHKKRADIQGLPTNLHVSYFRIYRQAAFGGGQQQQTMATTQNSNNSNNQTFFPPEIPVTFPVAQPSTEDLLGLGADFTTNTPATTTQQSSNSRINSGWNNSNDLVEVHATVTCGAPTAHAMGLNEYGLREMELEIHRLEAILDKCSPRVATTGVVSESTPPAIVADDAPDPPFSSLDDESEFSDAEQPNTLDLSDFVSTATNSHSSNSSSVVDDNKPQKVIKPKRPNLAVRAFAGAKAKAKKATSNSSTTTSSKQEEEKETEIKYPPLKMEPEEGIDPATSIIFATRILCRLEMLRTEYYLRKSIAVSQSLSSLVTCFVTKLELCLQETLPKNHQTNHVLLQMARIGFLVGWESLISSQGKELRMLSDAWVAIKCLETFSFQLVEDKTLKTTTCSSSPGSGKKIQLPAVDLVKREDQKGYTIRVFVPSKLFVRLPDCLQHGELIGVTTVLFTQGINEMQSLANMVGSSGVSIQSKINSTSLHTLLEFYELFSSFQTEPDQNIGSKPDEIFRLLRTSVEMENSSSKNTCILLHASDAVRSLNGGRITYCKSGKDRTAMSVTLEQAKLLVQRKRQVLQEMEECSGSGNENGPLEEVKEVANLLREFGVRIEIAKKNVGRFKYSFNSIQRKLLPEIYRPPMSTIQDMVTSVTARDS